MAVCKPISHLFKELASISPSSHYSGVPADHWSLAGWDTSSCSLLLSTDWASFFIRGPTTSGLPFLEPLPRVSQWSIEQPYQIETVSFRLHPSGITLVWTAAHAFASIPNQHVAKSRFPKMRRFPGSQPPPYLKPCQTCSFALNR